MLDEVRAEKSNRQLCLRLFCFFFRRAPFGGSRDWEIGGSEEWGGENFCEERIQLRLRGDGGFEHPEEFEQFGGEGGGPCGGADGVKRAAFASTAFFHAEAKPALYYFVTAHAELPHVA